MRGFPSTRNLDSTAGDHLPAAPLSPFSLFAGDTRQPLPTRLEVGPSVIGQELQENTPFRSLFYHRVCFSILLKEMQKSERTHWFSLTWGPLNRTEGPSGAQLLLHVLLESANTDCGL